MKFLASLTLIGAALTAPLGFAQSAPPPPAAASDEVIYLSPFEITSAQDDSWVATNAISGTRFNTPLSDLPLTINVVTSEFIRDIAASNLMDALRFTTGITQGSSGLQGVGGGNNFYDSFVIRGQQVRYAYRDGLRRWRAHEPAFMDRIEVIKGPTAILYGEALPGGTINYITKTPRFQAGGYVLARVDEHGGYRAEFDATAPLGSDRKFAYRVVGGFEGGETWRDNESREHRPLLVSLLAQPWTRTRVIVAMENTTSDLQNPQTNGSVAWRGPLNQGGTNLNGGIGNPIGLHPLARPGTSPYAAPVLNTYQLLRTENYSIRLEQNLAEGLDVRTVVNYIDTYSEGLNNYNNDVNVLDLPVLTAARTAVEAAPGDTVTIGGRQFVVGRGSTLAGNPVANATPGAYQGGVQRVAVYRPADGFGPLRFVGNSLGAPNLFNPNQIGPRGLNFSGNSNIDTAWQTDLTYQFDLGETRHRMLAGYETVRSRFVVRETADAQSWVRNPDGTAIPGSDRNFYGVAYDIARGIPVDIFGNEWTKGPPLTNAFTGGKNTQNHRSDSLYATYMGTFLNQRLNVLAGFRDSDIATRNQGQAWQEFAKTVPQFGALYKLTKAVSLYASHSESFLLTNERFPTVAPGSQNPGAYTPAELFPPQRGLGLDVGLKFDLRDRQLSGNVTYFEIQRDKIPITDPNVFDANGNNVRYPSGEEENQGVEVELFWRPSVALQFTAGATWVDSRFVKVTRGQDYLIGRPLFGVPEWQFSAFAKYTFQEGALKGSYVGGGAYYGDEVEIDPGRPFTHDGYVRFDLIAGYRHELMGRPVSWSLNVSNVLDEENYSGFTLSLPRRTISVSMRMDF